MAGPFTRLIESEYWPWRKAHSTGANTSTPRSFSKTRPTVAPYFLDEIWVNMPAETQLAYCGFCDGEFLSCRRPYRSESPMFASLPPHIKLMKIWWQKGTFPWRFYFSSKTSSEFICQAYQNAVKIFQRLARHYLESCRRRALCWTLSCWPRNRKLPYSAGMAAVTCVNLEEYLSAG